MLCTRLTVTLAVLSQVVLYYAGGMLEGHQFPTHFDLLMQPDDYGSYDDLLNFGRYILLSGRLGWNCFAVVYAEHLSGEKPQAVKITEAAVYSRLCCWLPRNGI